VKYIIFGVVLLLANCSEGSSGGSSNKTSVKESNDTSEEEESSKTSEVEESSETSEEFSDEKPMTEYASSYVSPFPNMTPNTEFDETIPVYISPVELEVEYIGEKEVKVLEGVITTKTLENKYFWKISGEVNVSSGSTITVEKGTTLFGVDTSSKLIFQKGAKIFALGDKENPIIFTSQKDILENSPNGGDWGGLQIFGDEVSSGTLKYVQIRYGGSGRNNGLELYSVGLGTAIEYLEIYNSGRDGLILNSGNVNIRHLLLIGNRGDSLVLQDWGGKMQNIYILQTNSVFGENSAGIQIEGGDYNMVISNMSIESLSQNAGDGIYMDSRSYIHLLNSEILGVRDGVCIISKDGVDNIENYKLVGTTFGKCGGGTSWAEGVSERDVLQEKIEISEESELSEPSKIDSWFDDYSIEYKGAFHPLSNSKWSESWSIQ
jgi:hypothetical protein